MTTLSKEMAKIIISKDPTGKAAVEDFDERQWLYVLNTGTAEPSEAAARGGRVLGPYHDFKERLKPCIQRVVRKDYGAAAPSTPHRDCDDWRELGDYDRFLNVARGAANFEERRKQGTAPLERGTRPPFKGGHGSTRAPGDGRASRL